MAKLKIARVLPVALTLVIIAVILAAIVTIIRVTFFPGAISDTTSTTSTDNSVGREALLSSTYGSSIKMTVRGAIVADENFKTYQIEISPNSRKLSTTTGYLGQPVAVDSKPNNIKAYEQFVNALDKANFVKGTEFTGSKNDQRGICATGTLYDFQVLSNGQIEKDLWTSTCEGSPGSLDASLEQVMNLFYAQLPNSNVTISKLWK